MRMSRLGLALLLFCFFPFRVSAQEWMPIDKGIAYQKRVFAVGESHDATVHAFKIDPKRLKIRPILSANAASIRSLGEAAKALIAINANFFDVAAKPLGLVVIDGKTVHPFKKISWWAVFCMQGERARIVHSSDYYEGQCTQAVEAGPRLVVNGVIPRLKEESSRKTAVGINAKGEVIFVVSDDRMPIRKLAAIFQKPEDQGGLGCPNAINMDGGTSTQLYVKTDELRLDVTSFIGVPVALGVFKK